MSKNVLIAAGPGTELPVLDLADCCAPIRRETIDAEGAVTLAEAFKALADPVRLQLLNLIATADTGEACACDLVEPGRQEPAHREPPPQGAARGRARRVREARHLGLVLRRPSRLDELQRVLGRR